MKKRFLRTLLTSICLVSLVIGCVGAAGTGETRDTAHLNAFIQDDPLNGDNGMETSPAAPLVYGAINIGFDVDGNAIEAVDEQDMFYDTNSGYYYLIGQSFAEGAFNYAPGVPYSETLSTDLPSFYRWSGMVTYRSTDMENWEFVSRWYPQEEGTGRHIIVKKPRFVYSEKTGKWVMWFLNNTKAAGEESVMIYTADSPEGPWGSLTIPTVFQGITVDTLNHDFQIKVDPKTGTGYLVQALNGIRLYRMTSDMMGVESEIPVQLGAEKTGFTTEAVISGGICLFYTDDWWYIMGSPKCGNCIGAPMSYIMAKSPEGPWLSPVTMSGEQPLEVGVVSTDGLLAQSHGAFSAPDGKGGCTAMIYGTHYRSSATGAPQEILVFNNSGENSLALSGQFWFTLEFNEDGTIRELEAKEYYELPLAAEVTSERAVAYQADLSITRTRSVSQTWTVKAGEKIACILPSVFQQTPDESPSSNKWVTQDALVNAPLLACLALPDGTVYNWTIDARTIAWAPRQIALNLPAPYTGGGTLTLTLSTKATNGGYGVALGKGPEGAVYAHIEKETTKYPGQMIYLRTSAEAACAPEITVQPTSVTVPAGTRVGFLVQADGVGVGYQWYHNGNIVTPHGVTIGAANESASAALRLAAVTKEDEGVYYCHVFNQAGETWSKPVTLTVKEDTHTDVPKNVWYDDATAFVSGQRIMTGTSRTTFSPSESLTRSVLATALYANAGKPATSLDRFIDVKSSDPYYSACNWVAGAGIMAGTANDVFSPEAAVTREEMVSALYLLAKLNGNDVSAAANLSAFTDADQIGADAVAAFSWACAGKLMSGKGGGVLDPAGNATRAEAAQIITNFYAACGFTNMFLPDALMRSSLA